MSPNVLARLQRGLDRLRPEDATSRTLAWIGLTGLGLFLLVGLAAPLVAPYHVDQTPGQPFEAPSLEHPLGTDDVGHDLLTLLMAGARVSLLVGLLGGLLAVGLGTLVGTSAGLAEGWGQSVLMRTVDVALTLPMLPLVIVATAFAGPGLWTTALVLAAVLWAAPARELRSEVLSVREREHVQASKAMGASRTRLALHNVLPSVLPIVVAQFAKAAGTAILLEASLAFLGLGDPTTPSWGTILFYAQQRSAFLTDAWLWWVVPPGLAITASVLCFVFVGFAVEDLASPDPRVSPTRDEDAPPIHLTDETDSSLAVHDLTVAYEDGEHVAVDAVSLEIEQGQTLGLVGASGSGKTSLALALVGLLPPAGRVEGGRMELADDTDRGDVDVTTVRGRRIALLPQEAANALNPLATAHEQVRETLDESDRGEDSNERSRELLTDVGLPSESHHRYPHELSGGMRQRVALAIALANDPDVVLADEPTTGLDTVTTVEILELLEALQAEHGFGLLVVSHDVPAISHAADRVAVLHEGQLVEVFDTSKGPTHPQARRMMNQAARNADTSPPDPRARATWPVLSVDGLAKTFPDRDGGTNQVLRDVDIGVQAGEVVALVGESGTGKSTIGRILAGLVRPDDGSVTVDGHRLETLATSPRQLGQLVHYLFQDPYASLPPARRVGSIVAEPLEIQGTPPDERQARVRQALEAVELVPVEEYLQRRPGALSGGERQRVSLARALVLEPRVLVADEPASMLDAPLKGTLLERIRALADDRDLATLLITHDLARAASVADRVLVLDEGRIVEAGPPSQLLHDPEHAATRALVEAAQRLDADPRHAPATPTTTRGVDDPP